MELATIAFKQFGYLQKSNINQEAMELYHGAGVMVTMTSVPQPPTTKSLE